MDQDLFIALMTICVALVVGGAWMLWPFDAEGVAAPEDLRVQQQRGGHRRWVAGELKDEARRLKHARRHYAQTRKPKKCRGIKKC